MSVIEVTENLWQLTAVHPDWTEDESGEDGWEPEVAWWVLATPEGAVLIDPLVEDWDALDGLVAGSDGVAAIVRTCHWHQRSISEAAERYGASVWAGADHDGDVLVPCDHVAGDGERIPGGVIAHRVERTDECALWLEAPSALVFGDAMLRAAADGALRVCPESWTQPPGGREELLARLRRLERLCPRRVLVSHGPYVDADGAVELTRALG